MTADDTPVPVPQVRWIRYTAAGEITEWGDCPEHDFGGVVGPRVLESVARPATHFVRDGQVVEYEDWQRQAKEVRPSFRHVWSNDTFAWEDRRSSEEVAAQVRARRDAELAACDWTQLPDVQRLDLVRNEAWASHRKALRDVTEQPGFPRTVEWPVAP